ncbi:MAG: DUF2924 domain-containing protein [Armatimonadetes bacterium]|nr:DUF2924 domain-containing protein [Armatimonadota bacterium]
MSRAVLRQITQLESLSVEELHERWRELFGSKPPKAGRAYLVRRLAYRVQELAYGGLSDITRAKLRDHQEAGTGGVRPLQRRKRRDDQPVVGTRFIREWRGQRFEVTVVVGGFEFEGRRYRSLSAIANAITGAHWNGRVFFGLSARRKCSANRHD